MLRLLRIIINFIFYIIEILLLFRFVLRLLNANMASSFVSWIYSASASLIAPFRDIFPTVNVAGLSVDFTTLFALIIYIIIGQLILRGLYYFDYTEPID